MPLLWFHLFLQDAGQGPVPLGRQNHPLLTAESAPVERVEPGKHIQECFQIPLGPPQADGGK